jgi:hypothetical protein
MPCSNWPTAAVRQSCRFGFWRLSTTRMASDAPRTRRPISGPGLEISGPGLEGG